MIIEATHIHKSFGSLEVLKGIDLTVAPREIISIVFPAPLAPTMEMISWGATVRSMPLSTSSEPKLLCIWLASMIIGW